MFKFSNLTSYNCLLRGAFLVLVFSVTAFGQSRAADTNTVAGNEEIQGTIKFPPGVTAVPVTVLLRSLSSPELKTVTNQDGEFRFRHLRPDSYTIIVDATDKYEKATETVSVGFSGSVPGQGNPFSHAYPAVYPVLIYLKPKGVRTEDMSEGAKKSYQEALKAQKAGDHSQAIKHLRTVVAEAPRFTPAYIELAAEYLKTGDGQLALDTLKKAVDIEPDNAALRLNYGIALLNQKQFASAETELRLSIQKSKEYSVTANYYLAVALLTERKIDEARTVLEGTLKHGGDKLPLVHRYLGGIYLQDKQYRKAADELETYLKLEPNAADAEKIRTTIKESRDKS